MTFTVSTAGTTTRDALAAVYIIDQENARRAKLVPPGTPLPKATNAEIKTSFEGLLAVLLASAHASYIAQEALANGPNKAEFKTAFENATAAQRAAALAALTA